MTAHDEDRLASERSPLDAVRGRYAQPSVPRWTLTAMAACWLPLGIGGLLRGQGPLGLVLGSVLGLVAVFAWSVPAARIDDEGIRLLNKPVIPWSQIVDVERPVDNGWKLPPAELLLGDGQRRALPMLSRAQSGKLREYVRQQASGGDHRTFGHESGLEGEHER